MIIEYHRPHTVEEALSLLSRKDPRTVPLGGGTFVNRRNQSDLPTAVVDLQELGLNKVERLGNTLEVGAMLTLQSLGENIDLPAAVKQALQVEANYNLRQIASLAGSLVAAEGRSPLATILLAMDAKIVWTPGGQEVSLGDWLPIRWEDRTGDLITKVVIPLPPKTAFASVSRTPSDRPIVCVGMAQWNSGRTRMALGGFGAAPMMAMDGPEKSGIAETARNAYSNAEDEWASAEYRQEMAFVLARRCINQIEGL
jgi:CO/xanthine dehydrogenase FAD-binding subunit